MVDWILDLWRGNLGGRSPSWRRVRNNFARKNPYCKCCGTKKKIEIHHCMPVSWDKSRELDEDNLITLCRTHHLWWGHLGSYRSFNYHIRKDAKDFYKKIIERP